MNKLTALAGSDRAQPGGSSSGNIYDGVGTEHAAPRKGYGDFVQHTGPMLSGQLGVSSSDAQTLPVTFGYSQARHNSFRVEQVLCRRNPRVQIKHEHYSGSQVPTKSAGSWRDGADLLHEKGNAANVALWMNSFLNHEKKQYSPDLGDNLLSLSELDQPFGLMPRTINSRRANSFIQFAKLTPSRSASVSNCVLSSGLIRMWNGGDFPAPLGWLSLTVTSFSIDMCTPIDLSLFSLGVHTNMCVPKKTTPPNGITSTERGLTTNDRLDIEVAMLDHITPLTGRNSLTPNKFTWRFLALNRHDKKAKPCRLSVEAYTEQEARRELAPHFILSFAARLPVQEVSHV